MGNAFTVDVGGVAVTLMGTDAARRDLLRQQVSAFAVLAGTDGDAETVIHCGEHAPTTPARPPDVDNPITRVWLGDGRLALEAYDWALSAGEGRAEVGGPGPALDPPLGWMIQRALGWLLAPHARYLLHDVGAVAYGRSAWLVVGASGMGKSTLSLAAIANGWSVLSDEAVVVQGVRGSLRVAGIHQHPAVPSELDHPLVASGEALGDIRQRVSLGAGLLTPGWWPVAGLLAVGHSASRQGEIVALEPNEPFRAIVGAFASSGSPGGAHFLHTAAALAELPAVRLGHGADASTRLGVAAVLLGEVAALTDAGEPPAVVSPAHPGATHLRDDVPAPGPAG